MKKVKRLMSFGGNDSETTRNRARKENIPRQNVAGFSEKERSPIPRVQFQEEFEIAKKHQKKALSMDNPPEDQDVFNNLSVMPKRSNLQRTKSRSVECVKGPEGRQNLRRSILKAQKEEEEQTGSSDTSLEGVSHFRKSRSQSYYAFR